MEAQIQYASLLAHHGPNLGIAILKSVRLKVGDLCYWDENGCPIRILNVFENSAVFLGQRKGVF